MHFTRVDFVEIQSLLNPELKFYAHRKETGEKELLSDHTVLCQKYYKKLLDEKEISKRFTDMLNTCIKNISDLGKKFYDDIIYNVVTFHDVGKCNPYYQSKKMNHLFLSNQELMRFARLNSNHSVLSAIVYLGYYLDRLKTIKNTEPDDYKMLRHILFINAYLISRHHSKLSRFEDFLNNFDKDIHPDSAVNYALTVMEESGRILFPDFFHPVHLSHPVHSFQIEGAVIRKMSRGALKYLKKLGEEEAMVLYTYGRLQYSLLVASDYYATTEFISGVEITDFGDLQELEEFNRVYQGTAINQKIREYEQKYYCGSNRESSTQIGEKDISILRNELFLDAEAGLQAHRDESIFYLEAPTGSGKSNVAFNLAFRLRRDNGQGKLFYVYPLNTLVEQNRNTLEKIFENHVELKNKITVINSITPIKYERDERGEKQEKKEEDNSKLYQKALLNRQFLNYPLLMTTNVSLFHTMFDDRQENIFAFHQLVNSVIVLDEIQNYKILIWTEIMKFLNVFAQMLHIKIIIMSATLPDLSRLIKEGQPMASLIKDRNKYFTHPLFKDRVQLDFQLLNLSAAEPQMGINIEEELFSHVLEMSKSRKKILMEFITKKSAVRFYERLVESGHEQESRILPLTGDNGPYQPRPSRGSGSTILLLTGDNNAIERARIIQAVSSPEAIDKGIILVATQVVEAGMDIDMDVGYKDVSKLDSEEQFLGRINRSCLKSGRVYFFHLDEMQRIYKNDFRTNREMTIITEEMREELKRKDFNSYYQRILTQIIGLNEEENSDNVADFLKDTVGGLDFPAIRKRMELIEEDKETISVYLARKIEDLDGSIIDGCSIWENYKNILQNQKMEYAKKQVILSEITGKMNYFIYQIKKGSINIWDDQVGELYYIEDGENYFEGDKFDREKLEERGGMFI